MPFIIRRALPTDLDFLVETDLLEEGYTPSSAEPPMTEVERAEHRAKITSFVTCPEDAGWVAVDSAIGQYAGMILARFRDRVHEQPTVANLFLFRFLQENLFPTDGRFCEVFQLWVAPQYRRQGLATRLKLELEVESRQRGICMIYTHTEAANAHVIELNRKLGYHEVRQGPLWDAVPRVSLTKWL